MNLPILLRILSLRRQLRSRDSWDRARIDRHQTESLRALRTHSYALSSFYRKHHAGLFDRPLRELSTVTKAMLMEQFDEVVTDRRIRLADVEQMLRGNDPANLLLDRYRLNATGGTTGRRGLFLFDEAEWITIIASYSRSYAWGGASPNLFRRMRMAVVSTTAPWHQSSQVGSTVRSWWAPTLRIDATDDLASTVERLNAFNPATLVSYASMARVLADEQIAGRLRITPRAVFTASEVLTGSMRSRIRKAWGKDPFDVYGATETSTIASECSGHHGRHLFEDLVITESVDEWNRPVPDGTVGAKVLVTVLFSRTLPLIRYEMSDSISILDEPCSCGLAFRRMGVIEGRREDTLLLPAAATRGAVRIHPNVFHDAIDELDLDGWQVAQKGSGLEIRLVGDTARVPEHEVAERVSRALASAGARPTQVVVRFVASIPRTTIGKAPLIVHEQT
jgi:phenylacetate-CoA ligase